MYIDTHAHLNFAAFKDDFDETIKRSLDSDTWMINVGSQLSTSQKAVEIASQYKTELKQRLPDQRLNSELRRIAAKGTSLFVRKSGTSF